MIALISSTDFHFVLANSSISFSSVGTNSCRGGSRKRIVTLYHSIASYNFSKSPCCIGSNLLRAASLSSTVSEQIISLIAPILSGSKNMCSVLQSQIPSAPNSLALAASVGVSALVLTFNFLYLSAQAMILQKSPETLASTVGMAPS